MGRATLYITLLALTAVRWDGFIHVQQPSRFPVHLVSHFKTVFGVYNPSATARVLLTCCKISDRLAVQTDSISLAS